MMKRVVAAAIDDALDQASVTPAQRTAIHAARDRVFAAFEQQHQARGARMDDLLRLFEADQIDPAEVAALRQARDERHAQLADAIQQALVEAHDTLTPAQRKVVADYARAHHRHRH
jgi:Spy/CpxP family protein refolding chaperone